MCSGRFVKVRQRRVLVAHEALERAAAKPQQPEAAEPDTASTTPARSSSSRAVARSGPAGANATRPPIARVGNLRRRHLQPSTCGYFSRNFSPRNRQ